VRGCPAPARARLPPAGAPGAGRRHLEVPTCRRAACRAGLPPGASFVACVHFVRPFWCSRGDAPSIGAVGMWESRRLVPGFPTAVERVGNVRVLVGSCRPRGPKARSRSGRRRGAPRNAEGRQPGSALAERRPWAKRRARHGGPGAYGTARLPGGGQGRSRSKMRQGLAPPGASLIDFVP
jgi:hypothetical protein